MNSVNERLEALEKHSHEPQDIAPRVIEELNRAVMLLTLFEKVPTEYLEYYSQVGLEMKPYLKDENDPRGVDR